MARRKSRLKKSTGRFKKGDKVAIAVHGAGVISYEPDIVERVERGKVYLKGNDEHPFDEDSGLQIYANQGAFGFTVRLVSKAEVPEDEWERRCKDFWIEP